MEYAVKGETHNGTILVLRGNFISRAAAEDHLVTMSQWKRVWVEEEIGDEPFTDLRLGPGRGLRS